MQRELLLPASIVVGSGLIGLGLFMGLRERAPASSAQAVTQAAGGASLGEGRASGPRVSTAAPERPSVSAVPAQESSPNAKGAEEVQKAALAALLAAKKESFLPKCWEPAVKNKPQPGVAKYTFDLTFDAQGKQITYGVTEHREAERADVATCLRQLPLALTIAPPGVSTRVEIDLEFP